MSKRRCEAGQGRFDAPLCPAVVPDGTLDVGDTGCDRVLVFRPPLPIAATPAP